MDRPHEDYRDLVAAYVLGAIPPDDLAEVAHHIASCTTCLEQAKAHSGVTDELALSVDPVPLPAGFADAVLTKAHRTGPAPTEIAEPTGGRVLFFRRPVMSGILAAAAAVIIGVLGAGFLDARSDLHRSRQVISALTADRGLALTGEEGSEGHMVRTEDGALFAAVGLPEPPAGRTYQLWAFQDETPTSLATFGVEEGEAVVRIEDPAEGVDALAVTVEPEGGSERPSTDPVMRSA